MDRKSGSMGDDNGQPHYKRIKTGDKTVSQTKDETAPEGNKLQSSCGALNFVPWNLPALVGCQYYRAYMDQHDKIHEVLGTVTECCSCGDADSETSTSKALSSKKVQYRVEYDANVREKMNKMRASSIPNGDKTNAGVNEGSVDNELVTWPLPDHEYLDMEHGWGGCWQYMEKFGNQDDRTSDTKICKEVSTVSPCITLSQQRFILANCSPPRQKIFVWHVPETIEREQVPLRCESKDETTALAPRVTMTFRGFHIVFQVKQSTLQSPHAGRGLFLSCRRIDEGTSNGNTADTRSFTLPTGELLDMGVYAPFVAQDDKTVKAFNEKCARLTNSQCLEFAFFNHTEDTVFDITDETGILHSQAKQHIAPYVNEVTNPYVDEQIVYSAYDPHGALHYLLGNRHLADGDFSFPEIFTDYGVMYEPVRRRKGYALASN